MKSELAIKRDEWFESDEGKRCCDPTELGLPSRKYLRNRLERAFLAGAEANEAVKDDLCHKLSPSDES